MVYFQFLESNQYLIHEKNYLFGDLLEQTGSEFEESVLVLLEMLRIMFPAASDIVVPPSHEAFHTSKTDQSLRLLKRVFSLFPVKRGTPKMKATDFEMCLFNNYAQMLKRQLRFLFQTTLFKNY